MKDTQTLLQQLNTTYARLHSRYENLFWKVYMGDHSLSEKMSLAQGTRDAFASDPRNLKKVQDALEGAVGKEKEALEGWKVYFEKYQTPPELLPLREKIAKLEGTIFKKQNSRKEGYVDPYTKKFVVASLNALSNLVYTHQDEKIRKAAYEAKELLAQDCLGEYVELVKLRNEYARALGFEDFFSYKADRDEGMTKKELVDLFDSVYEKTKGTFDAIRELEKENPRLRKPWNFGYMMSGDFTKQEDPYFQFKNALPWWGRSFSAMGIDYRGGTLTLDLLDRKGKHSNGFCHWPKLVEYKDGKRIPGSSNFTCNVVPTGLGEGSVGMYTLFHEGGHAAHLLNVEQTQVCYNHEYPPTSMAWAETQSMFLEGVFSSIDWRTRYAHNDEGDPYPFSLFEQKVKKLHVLWPRMIFSVSMVSEFERRVYEEKHLTPEKVMRTARKMHVKYTDQSPGSLWILNAIHIYSWDSACAYHGYGLAKMAVEQWREYFYKKYGYIVDNPQVGKEMREVWKLGSSKTFNELVRIATGKKLSSAAYVKSITKSPSSAISTAKKKIKQLESVKKPTGPIDLNATIRLTHGTKTIATNKKSFEDMTEKYAKWLEKQG